MVTDERRRELLLDYFSDRVELEFQRYETSHPQAADQLARQRLKLALATVCTLLPHGGRILDVGSGCGLGASTLADLGYQVTAVELVPKMVELAKENHGDQVQWLTGPFVNNLAEKQSFDIVMCLEFLEYQERAGKELVKMRRYLKPGGNLLLSVPNTLSPGFLLGVKRALFRLQKEPEHVAIRHSFTPERLQRLLGMAGFIFLDYQWLPEGEGDPTLALDRTRDMWRHRVKYRAAPEFLTLSRTYTPEDTAY